MKMLLGCTGRGGEQCIFSAIVAAYKKGHPDYRTYIAVPPEFAQYWHHDKRVTLVLLEHEDPNAPYFKDPIGKWHRIASGFEYSFSEFIAEYGNWKPENPAIENIWEKLRHRPCTLEQLERKVCLTPGEDDLKVAEEIRMKYGEDLVVISPKSNSACEVIPPAWYKELAHQIGKHYPVATTGRGPGSYCGQPTLADEAIPGTIDLVGRSILSLYAMSSWLKRFVGPDTATPWVVANMPGKLLVIRGDDTFPISNTGLVVNGFRSPTNTMEYHAVGKTLTEVIDTCLAWIL